MSYFGHASLFLPDFDAFVSRLPKGTQANSQVCFRWMSKWWINEYRENLELYHTKKNAAENNYYSKVFVTVKTCSSFLNLLVQRVLILFWKYLLVKEEELFCLWKVSKFLLATLFANARSVDVSKLRVENTAILRLRPRKQIFLLFSKKKAFCENNLHQITYQLKLLWTENEGNRFFNSCHSMVDISWPSLLIVYQKNRGRLWIQCLGMTWRNVAILRCLYNLQRSLIFCLCPIPLYVRLP